MATIAEIQYVDSLLFFSRVTCDIVFVSEMHNSSRLSHETEVYTVTLLQRTVTGYYRMARIEHKCPQVSARSGENRSANLSEMQTERYRVTVRIMRERCRLR